MTSDSHQRHNQQVAEAYENAPYKHLIGGEWVAATSGDTMPVIDPTTGQIHTTVQMGDAADVDAAVGAAASQTDPWAAIDSAERSATLVAIGDAIKANRERLAKAIALDAGRPIREATSEVDAAADRFAYYGALARTISGQTLQTRQYDISATVREPYGVVACIVPWNFPLMLTANKVAPSLAAGNTVVVKPAEQASAAALEFLAIVDDHLPDGVVNVVTGEGATTGSALTEHESVAKISFTGSRRVGAEVMRTAAATITPVTLELGGNNPAIVFPDANIEKAVEDVMIGIFFNSGQVCGATSRLFLHDSIADEFMEQFTTKTTKIKIGDPLEPTTEMGPMITGAQRERVESYLADARDRGATMVTGGGTPDDPVPDEGHFLEPSILKDVPSDAAVACEEVFGPVEVVETWSEYDDVIERANDTEYGLGAAIWTDDYRTIVRAFEDLEIGNLDVNLSHRVPSELPYGGVKDSGFGREQGEVALEEFSRLKGLNADRRDRPLDIF